MSLVLVYLPRPVKIRLFFIDRHLWSSTVSFKSFRSLSSSDSPLAALTCLACFPIAYILSRTLSRSGLNFRDFFKLLCGIIAFYLLCGIFAVLSNSSPLLETKCIVFSNSALFDSIRSTLLSIEDPRPSSSYIVLILQILKIVCVMNKEDGFDELFTKRLDRFGKSRPCSRNSLHGLKKGGKMISISYGKNLLI